MANILGITCPECGRKQDKELNSEEFKNLFVKKLCLQEALPNRDPFFRETLKTGLCNECQSEIFHRPVPGDTSWGEVLGECRICGAPVYSEKDKTESGIRCHSCDTLFNEKE